MESKVQKLSIFKAPYCPQTTIFMWNILPIMPSYITVFPLQLLPQLYLPLGSLPWSHWRAGVLHTLLKKKMYFSPCYCSLLLNENISVVIWIMAVSPLTKPEPLECSSLMFLLTIVFLPLAQWLVIRRYVTNIGQMNNTFTLCEKMTSHKCTLFLSLCCWREEMFLLWSRHILSLCLSLPL